MAKVALRLDPPPAAKPTAAAICRIAATIDRQKRKFKRAHVRSYTSHVAICRDLSRFGVFATSFLACARATGMQDAGGHLALFGTLFSGARGGGGELAVGGGQRTDIVKQKLKR